ncbi:MAG: hypothetical protein QOI35_3325 [Cryptosporangiaceae bacterium]|jgi:hypothetical protein|nr:hypothetical protein [Cryptosporangiaceae bacterium]
MSTSSPVHAAATEGRHTGQDASLGTDKTMCMACDHPAADHDAIGRRYCNATVERALTRGCICSVSPA